MKKRILSILLAVTLLLSTFSITAFATDIPKGTSTVTFTSTITNEDGTITENSVEVTVTNDNTRLPCDIVTYQPADGNIKAGFIFYPGANVDYRDYSPLLERVAAQGYLVVSTEFPMDFAFLDMFACYRTKLMFPEVSKWYIGGHSLGGVMASTIAALNPTSFEGVVLLASYANMPLSIWGIPVLSLYGSNDGVLNTTSYNLFKFMINGTLTEHVIEGGNHSQFGDYGFQSGDNEASISAEAQWDEAAAYMGDFFAANN